jgi:DNA (cytosine-5)-methyltransferase 1
MKILNLYACLGGNRYKWNEVHDNLEITAVELDPEAARLYKERFPKDIVIVADAHQFLLNNYKKFDFIWSSPPCPSHSRARISNKRNYTPLYPDLKLYEEILFLQYYFDGKFCVENVVPYYDPLIPGQKRGRHLYWTNFYLPYNLGERKSVSMECKDEVKKWCEFHEFNFYSYKGNQSVQKMARNLVDFEAGKNILKAALGVIEKSQSSQISLFENI